MDKLPAGNKNPLTNTPRRWFLKQLGSACAAASFGLGLTAHVERANALPAQALRPPGALDEEAFDAACVRCGLCVRACPFAILNLAPFGAGIPVGTPYFEARSAPCEMCTDIPCMHACPTNALSPNLESIEASHMGLAVLADQERCLSLQGIHCDACYRACPVKDQAITMERFKNPRGAYVFMPTVHSQACTGCGKCEHACVPDIAVIRVFPIAMVKEGFMRDQWRKHPAAGLPPASAPAIRVAPGHKS